MYFAARFSSVQFNTCYHLICILEKDVSSYLPQGGGEVWAVLLAFLENKKIQQSYSSWEGQGALINQTAKLG